MLDTQGRSAVKIMFSPAVRIFGVLSPTALSLIGLLFAFLLAGALIQQNYVLGLVFWSANRFFDGMDGIVARRYNKQTDIGGYIDILCDFTAYALTPLALVYGIPSPDKWFALAILLVSFYINSASWMYLSAILEKRQAGAEARGENTSVTIPGGLVGGTLTVVFYYVFILFPAQIVPLFWIMAVLVMVGVGQRLVWALKTLSE